MSLDYFEDQLATVRNEEDATFLSKLDPGERRRKIRATIDLLAAGDDMAGVSERDEFRHFVETVRNRLWRHVACLCGMSVLVMLHSLDQWHARAAEAKVWAPLCSNFSEWWEKNKEERLKEQARVRQRVSDWSRMADGTLCHLQGMLDEARRKVAAKKRMDLECEAAWRRDQEELMLVQEREEARRAKHLKEEAARLNQLEAQKKPGSWGQSWNKPA